MKNYIYFLLLGFILSCAPIRVEYDYEKGTDFSEYKTFNYYDNLETGMSELDDKRLIAALNSELQKKGMVISDTPDFYIDIKSETYRDINQNNTVGVGMGGTGRNVGGGVSVGIPLGSSNMNRRVIVDFRKAEGDVLFWQAVSDSSVSLNSTPAQREADFKALVEKILSKYPPK
ncbi:MAG: DUF4136 domain-containing protein [Flavobacteriaceae bacterium]|nr:DUF4136 domain-containing protein [Flavobacteriaceae bacterium]